MIDIAKCDDKDCPLKEKCYRYECKWEEICQDYFSESPREGEECRFFIEFKARSVERRKK